MAAFLSVGLFQTSCNKDEDKNALPAATLLGKWNYEKEGQIVGGTEVLVDYQGNDAGCFKDYIIFNSNNTLLDVDYDSFATACEEFSEVGTYVVAGNTISVDFGDGITTAEILNLSYTELKVKDSDGYILVLVR